MSRIAGENVFNRYKEFHQQMRDENDWFVVLLSKGEPYYIKGDIDRLRLNQHKIINCNWTKEQWHTTPLEIEITRPYINETFVGEDTDYIDGGLNRFDVGRRCNGEWYFKNFKDGNLTFWGKPYGNEWTMHHKSIATNYTGKNGGFRNGRFTTFDYVTEDQPNYDIVIKVLKAMSKDKYKGFYDDCIKWIKDVTGVSDYQFK